MKPRETYTDKDGSVWVACSLREEIFLIGVPLVAFCLLCLGVIWVWRAL